jgi:hypothetical protein
MNVALSHPLRLSVEDQQRHAARIWMPGKKESIRRRKKREGKYVTFSQANG